MKRKFVAIVVLLISVAVALRAQTPTTNAPATGTGVTNGTAPGTTNPNPSSTTGGANGVTTSSPPVMGNGNGTGAQRPIFLTGVVMMDDGSALPGGVSIVSVCGANRRTMSHTTESGSFAFQWSVTSGVFGDASQVVRLSGGAGGSASLTGSRNGSRGLDPLANCDLTAELAGYSASRVSLYDRAGQDNYDVGVLVLHLIASGEGHTVSVLALKAPKEAKRDFDRGNSLAAANKPREAAAMFSKAVELYPQYADAWLSLGKLQWQMLDKPLARASFRKAMELDAKLVGPWQELGFLACDDSEWSEASRLLEQAVRLDPMDSPNAWYYLALANYNLGRFDAAERGVRAEMKLDRGANPPENLLLGLILLARRDLEGSAAALRNYIAAAPPSEDVTLAKKQLSVVESRLRQQSPEGARFL